MRSWTNHTYTEINDARVLNVLIGELCVHRTLTNSPRSRRALPNSRLRTNSRRNSEARLASSSNSHPTLLLTVSSRPTSSPVPATSTLPGTRWTSWIPRQPRRCSWLRWNGWLRSAAAWLRHASSLWTSSAWPRIRWTASSRRIFSQQPAHADRSSWTTETADAGSWPRSGTYGQWKQARYTSACSRASSPAAVRSGQHKARTSWHSGFYFCDSCDRSSAACRVEAFHCRSHCSPATAPAAEAGEEADRQSHCSASCRAQCGIKASCPETSTCR